MATEPLQTAPIQAIHDFWFGPLSDQGLAAPEKHNLWFTKSDDTAAHCRNNFGTWVDQALAGTLDHWQSSAAGRVALVLLLDQFTRNIYRDTPKAFAGDPAARLLSKTALDDDEWQGLPSIHKVFLLMPLEHSESIADQTLCVEQFTAITQTNDHPQIANFLRYAQAHKDVIQRFGRFPHRNAILGRPCTAEELSYLETNSGF